MGSVRSGACEPLFCLMPTLLLGNCLEKLAEMPDCSIDAIITDPPYGLSFMGKKWDYDVPSVEVWAECLRVLKPGGHMLAFAGTRTQHRMAVRIEDAGFEIRDMIAWVYGCLSEDSEVLTEDGWMPYNRAKQKNILAYDLQNDIYQWERPSRWNEYRVESDTAYRIQSDYTDQIVSRGHRCIVERGGVLTFVPADELASMERVPYLRSDISALPQGRGELLLQAVLRESEGLAQATFCERQGEEVSGEGFAGGEKPGVEGWRDLLQAQGQVCGSVDQVRPLPCGTDEYGPQGWVCDGASASGCDGNWKTADKDGMCTPHQPRCDRQQAGELDAVCDQCGSQAVRARASYQTTVATVTAIEYRGLIWCPTVSTGAFVARRNGKVFITGNSGFPKSLDVSKAIDKAAGVEFSAKPASGVGFMNAEGAGGYNTTLNQLTREGDSTPEAQQWDGWGTALKPALEPITVARKPFKGTVAANVLEHGTGAINIDGCRVGTSRGVPASLSKSKSSNTYGFGATSGHERELDPNIGRWPANLIHDGSDEVVGLFPQTGISRGGNSQQINAGTGRYNWNTGTDKAVSDGVDPGYGDSGSAARFFYCAKTSKRERNAGLDMLQCISIQIRDQWGSEVHKVRLQVDMAQSRPRVTGGSDTTADTEWSTVLFGNSTTGPFPMGCKCITRMATSSTTLLETLNYSARLSTSENIADVNCAMESSTSHVANVESASRWKLSFTSEREACLPGVGLVASQTQWTISDEGERPGNFHPTCKPIALMRYLCRLVTPPSGTVLDPFMGSGSTGIAAGAESFNFVGIELDPDYFAIAEQRIKENELPSEMLAD
jgi:DNA modification methylase